MDQKQNKNKKLTKKITKKNQTKIPTKFRLLIVPGSTPIVFKLRKLWRMLLRRSKR